MDKPAAVLYLQLWAVRRKFEICVPRPRLPVISIFPISGRGQDSPNDQPKIVHTHTIVEPMPPVLLSKSVKPFINVQQLILLL